MCCVQPLFVLIFFLFCLELALCLDHHHHWNHNHHQNSLQKKLLLSRVPSFLCVTKSFLSLCNNKIYLENFQKKFHITTTTRFIICRMSTTAAVQQQQKKKKLFNNQTKHWSLSLSTPKHTHIDNPKLLFDSQWIHNWNSTQLCVCLVNFAPNHNHNKKAKQCFVVQ